MLGQMQPSLLSTLLTHPDVQQGIQEAHEAIQEGFFGDDVLAELQTEEEVITFLEEELSRMARVQEKHVDQLMGWKTLSYWHNLGFTLAWIDQAMVYQQQRKGQSS